MFYKTYYFLIFYFKLFVNKQHTMTVTNGFQIVSIDRVFTILSYNINSYNFNYFE